MRANDLAFLAFLPLTLAFDAACHAVGVSMELLEAIDEAEFWLSLVITARLVLPAIDLFTLSDVAAAGRGVLRRGEEE